MSSMKSALNKWLGKDDVSRMGSDYAVCESPLSQEVIHLAVSPPEPAFIPDPEQLRLPQEVFRTYPYYQSYQPSGTIEYLREIGFLKPSQAIGVSPELEKAAVAKVEAKAVALRTLVPGDRFVIQGEERVLQVISVKDNHTLVRDIENLEMEEFIASTKVVKVGHQMGKPSVCEEIPKEVRDKMTQVSEASWNIFYREAADPFTGEKDRIIRTPREMGTVITSADYTLGNITEPKDSKLKSTVKVGDLSVVKGTDRQVDIPRGSSRVDIPEGSRITGTFHTHPGGQPAPLDFDLVDMLAHDDKIQCICSTGTPGTKCQCFTPHEPEWTNVRNELNSLLAEIRQFNRDTHSKYGLKGKALRKFLQAVGAEPYLRGELPYLVQAGPAYSSTGVRRPLTTRPVIGTTPITLELKQQIYADWRGAAKFAEQKNTALSITMANAKGLLDQIRDLSDSAQSVIRAAEEAGNFITIYYLDRFTTAQEVQALRDLVGKHAMKFGLPEIPFHYYAQGDPAEYQRAIEMLASADTELINLRAQRDKIIEAETRRQGSIPEAELRSMHNDLEALNDQIDNLYTQRFNYQQLIWAFRPNNLSVLPNVGEVLILAEEKTLPIAQNEAMAGVIEIETPEAIGIVDKRAAEIKARDDKLKGEIRQLESNKEQLLGVEGVGGRAQVFREIMADKTRPEAQRAEARAALDNIENYQKPNINKALTAARQALKTAQYHIPGQQARRYSPEIQNLLSQISDLTNQLSRLQPELSQARIMAEDAQDKADELKADVDVLAKNRTTEYQAAQETVQRGNRLEARRQAFLTQLRRYELQAGYTPEQLAGQPRLLDACKLVWEEPGTIELSEFGKLSEMPGLLSEAFQGARETGYIGAPKEE